MKIASRWTLALGILLLAAVVPAVASAQATPPAEDPAAEQDVGEPVTEEDEGEPAQTVEEEITVTGTRVEGRSATDTPAPVDYITNETIRDAGAVETGKILQLVAPSFNFSTTTISDGTDI